MPFGWDARRWALAGGGLAAVIVAVAFILVLSGGEEAAAGEVFLEPAASTGQDPFTPAVSQGQAVVGAAATPAPPPAEPAGGIQSASGSTPGLYGGTQDNSSCDRDQMVDFLRENADKARAWVEALNADPSLRWSGGRSVPVEEIGTYVNELTPAVLRGDTRVTNHGFTGGRANPLQQVLQAGTAVLVDRFGVPRTRCACGNPLTEPKAASGTVTYRGPRWPGFSPRTIVVVQPSATVIDDFTFVDVITGDPFTRPAGTEGDSDSAGAPPTIPTPLPEPTAGSPTAPPSPGVTPEPTEAEIPIEGTYSMTLEGLRGDCGEVTEEGSDTIRIVVHSLPTDSSDGSATLRSEGDPIELVLQPGLYFEGGGEGGTISGRFEAAGGTTVIQAEVNFAGCTFRWSGERTGD